MKNKVKSKSRDELPEQFGSLEEAGAFWDTHDVTEYLDHMVPVNAEVRLEERHYEIEIEAQLVEALERRAKAEKVPVVRLANELLKRELVPIP